MVESLVADSRRVCTCGSGGVDVGHGCVTRYAISSSDINRRWPGLLRRIRCSGALAVTYICTVVPSQYLHF